MSVLQQDLFGTESLQEGLDAELPEQVNAKAESFRPSGLPKLKPGWRWMSVGELVANEPNAMTDGPFGSKLKTEHYKTSGPRVVRLQNIGDAVFNDAHAHISEEHFRGLHKHRVIQGDIVIAALGEVLPRSCIIPESLGPAIVKADCIRFKPKPEHSVKYLNYALNWEGTRKRTKEIVHGVGRPRLNLKEIKSILLPVAPPEEQPGIVEEIETQLSRLEAGVSALKRAQANLKRYRAAVLKAACEGRLVPTEAELARAEGRDYETGAQLLDRIHSERKRMQKKAPAQPDGGDLPSVPKGWIVASLEELSGHVTSGSRDWSRYYGRGTGTFILAQNVRPMRLDLSERQAVDAPEGDAETIRTLVRQHDLLVTIVGAKTGDVCRVPHDLDQHYVCQSVALVRPVWPALARFMEIWLAGEENGQKVWEKYIYGQGRPHLSFEQLKITPMPLPPLAEQERIVAEVERRLSVVDELEATITANLRRATRLRQSVLAAAFSGGHSN